MSYGNDTIEIKKKDSFAPGSKIIVVYDLIGCIIFLLLALGGTARAASDLIISAGIGGRFSFCDWVGQTQKEGKVLRYPNYCCLNRLNNFIRSKIIF